MLLLHTMRYIIVGNRKKHVHKYMHVQYNMKCPVEMCTAWCDPYQQLNYGTISLRVIP